MNVEATFGMLGVNAAAILVAFFIVTQLYADAITLGEIRYRMRCLQRQRYLQMSIPKSGYLQSLRFHIRGTVSEPLAAPHIIVQRPQRVPRLPRFPEPLFYLEDDSYNV